MSDNTYVASVLECCQLALAGVNRHNWQRGAKLIQPPLDGQPVLETVVVIVLPILSMLNHGVIPGVSLN